MAQGVLFRTVRDNGGHLGDATPLLRAALVPLLFSFLFGTQRGIMWLQGATGGGDTALAEQVRETLTTPSADLCAGAL